MRSKEVILAGAAIVAMLGPYPSEAAPAEAPAAERNPMAARRGVVPFAAVANSSANSPASRPDAPAYGLVGRVSDHAAVLTSGERADIESRLASYEGETGHQLAVLTVPHLAGEEIDAYALRTANAFGLGRKGIDNGILLMVTIRERKIRIELGRGFSEYISDEDAARIVAEDISPHLARGRFAEGLTRGVTALMARARRLVVPRN
jgi:uncharacterized protein